MNNLLTEEQVNSLPIAQAATYQFLVDNYLNKQLMEAKIVENKKIDLSSMQCHFIINTNGSYY